MCFASLLSGALEGKVRSVVASQVAANPIPCTFNKLKAGLHIPGVMEALGIKGITVDTDEHASWTDWLFDKFVKGVDYVVLPYEELCNNPVCHRCVANSVEAYLKTCCKGCVPSFPMYHSVIDISHLVA